MSHGLLKDWAEARLEVLLAKGDPADAEEREHYEAILKLVQWADEKSWLFNCVRPGAYTVTWRDGDLVFRDAVPDSDPAILDPGMQKVLVEHYQKADDAGLSVSTSDDAEGKQ